MLPKRPRTGAYWGSQLQARTRTSDRCLDPGVACIVFCAGLVRTAPNDAANYAKRDEKLRAGSVLTNGRRRRVGRPPIFCPLLTLISRRFWKPVRRRYCSGPRNKDGEQAAE